MTFRAPLWLVSLLLVALVLAGCSREKEPPALVSATMTDKVHEQTKAPLNPMTSFPSGSTLLYLSALVSNPAKGTVVEARWLYDREGKGNFANVDNTPVTFEKPARQQYVAFSLQAATVFPAGAYKVQILLDGKMVKEVAFTVQ